MDNEISRSMIAEVLRGKSIDTEPDVEYVADELYKRFKHFDAVPVVRCKDCVHSVELDGYPKRRFENGLNCKACRGDNGYGIANLSLTTPDGYCDDGVMRWEDEEE